MFISPFNRLYLQYGTKYVYGERVPLFVNDFNSLIKKLLYLTTQTESSIYVLKL